MKLANKEVKAIIFDLDGTLLDSTSIWADIDKEFFAKRNMEIPITYADEISHIGLKEAAILTSKKYCINEKPEDIVNEWKEASKKYYEEILKLKEGVKEYLNYLKNNNIKMAIATANNKTLYIPCLKRLGIYEYFDVLADVETVNAGKDSVELYDYVAKKLNEKREDIAIFEDLHTGLKTAYLNGFISVAVYDNNSQEEDLKRQYSHLYINSFKELI